MTRSMSCLGLEDLEDYYIYIYNVECEVNTTFVGGEISFLWQRSPKNDISLPPYVVISYWPNVVL